MNTIICKLLPLIEDLTPVVVQVLSLIQAQTGKSIEEILSSTDVLLSKNEAALLADIANLKKEAN